MPSSVLVEIGYAIALMKKTIIFVKQISDLPFMLEKANLRNTNIKTYTYKDNSELINQLKTDKTFIFNFNTKKRT